MTRSHSQSQRRKEGCADHFCSRYISAPPLMVWIPFVFLLSIPLFPGRKTFPPQDIWSILARVVMLPSLVGWGPGAAKCPVMLKVAHLADYPGKTALPASFSKSSLEQYNFYVSFISNFLLITGLFHVARNQVFMWHIFIVKHHFSCSVSIFSYCLSFPVWEKHLKRI